MFAYLPELTFTLLFIVLVNTNSIKLQSVKDVSSIILEKLDW